MYRLGAMASLLSREDVIVVASVSALYGLGQKRFFQENCIQFEVGKKYDFKEIKKQHPVVKVIILSMHNEAGMIKSLIDLGANGYLLKSCTQDELVDAIKKVASGQSYFSSDVTLALLKPATNQGQQNEILTERETEILKLIAAGFSNKEIGEQLFISHRTVDTHRTNLMKKLDVNNIAGLISYAIRNGIV